jgi:hypothetical protein
MMRSYTRIKGSTSVGKGKLAIVLGNIAPVLFLFAVQAAVDSMNKNWRFRKLDLSVSSKNRLNQRGNGKKGQRPLDFNRSCHADDAAFIESCAYRRIDFQKNS